MATITIDVDRYLSDDEEYKEEIMENKDFRRIIDDWSRTLLGSFYLEVVAKYGVDRAQILKKLLLVCEGYSDLETDYDFADSFIGKLAEGGFRFRQWPFDDETTREVED